MWPAVATPQVVPLALVCTVAPVHVVVAVGVGATTRPDGSGSVKVAAVMAEAALLVMVKVAVEYVAGVPVTGMVVGENAFVIDGRLFTLRLAEAAPPGPPLSEVTVDVTLLYVPAP